MMFRNCPVEILKIGYFHWPGINLFVVVVSFFFSSLIKKKKILTEREGIVNLVVNLLQCGTLALMSVLR